jgi:hypothetical protein
MASLAVIHFVDAIDVLQRCLPMRVWPYFRFPLSLRMVEDMLAARGVIVSHPTVRLWAEKSGRHFANGICRRSAGSLGDKWHLGAVVITVAGKSHWLWRAVDQDGYVLDEISKPAAIPKRPSDCWSLSIMKPWPTPGSYSPPPSSA